jgi:NAD(P)H-hydrate repair Nnr-like enzyme with NAD(P)H-hydrate dehydratase domain
LRLLTGMIVSLRAQGYSSVDAAIVGVYIHGLAADLALKDESEESLISGDIVKHIGGAFKTVKNFVKPSQPTFF